MSESMKGPAGGSGKRASKQQPRPVKRTSTPGEQAQAPHGVPSQKRAPRHVDAGPPARQ
jgi:hypothetical protein